MNNPLLNRLSVDTFQTFCFSHLYNSVLFRACNSFLHPAYLNHTLLLLLFQNSAHQNYSLSFPCLLKPRCQNVCVAQSCLTLCSPMDYSPPGSPVHGTFQARILEQFAISSSRASSPLRERTVSLTSPVLAGEFSLPAVAPVKPQDARTVLLNQLIL